MEYLLERPRSAAARPVSSTKKKKTPRDEKSRGNLYKYLNMNDGHNEKSQSIEKTPIGISKTHEDQSQLFSSRKKEIFEDFNQLFKEEDKSLVFHKTELKTHPVTHEYTSYFKQLDKDAGISSNKLQSVNIDRKVLKNSCNEDFQKYWLSEKSLIKPSDRIKVVTYKPDKKLFEDGEVEDKDLEEEDISRVDSARSHKENRIEKMLRSGGKDIIYIDPIAIRMKAEEIQLLAECKAEYRRTYNEVRKGLERGGNLEATSVGESSTIDAATLIGNPTFVDATTPADELIISAATSNVGPFFIMEFMKPLLNKTDNINFSDIVEIDLSSKMLGDEKCLCVASALKHTPNLRRINIAGNALTDKSISPILEECLGHLRCTFIDVSDNKVDANSISLLRKALLSSDCSILELVLSSADIDDEECVDLVSSINHNQSVIYLDLSHNAIGKKEEYNSVFPDFITGGEALSDLLRHNHCLQELNVSWNHICKESAQTLAKSLGENTGLITLNISYNNIGDVAAQHLANSLRHHPTLTMLDVSYNMILPRGVMVFAHALTTNKALKEINLNGNSIGQLGLSVLLRSVRQLAKNKRVINVHYRGGNLIYHDPTVFNRDNPSGNYKLDLSSPYDAVVAFWLHEIGNAKPISKFKDVMWCSSTSAQGQQEEHNRWLPIKLTRDVTIQSSNGPWDLQISNLSRLCDSLSELIEANGSKMKIKFLRKEISSAVKLIGKNLSLRFRDSFVEKVRVAIECMPALKRGMVHEVLKVVFRTAFRLVVKYHNDEDCWMHKENLVKCFNIIGFGFSEEETLQNQMIDEEGGNEGDDSDHDESHYGAGKKPLNPHGQARHDDSHEAGHHHAKHAHVHSNNYEMIAADEGDKLPTVEKLLVEQIHHIEEMGTSGRERLLMAERIIAGQNFDGSDILDESNFIKLMFTLCTEVSPPPANPLLEVATRKPWELPKEGKLHLKFICDRMPPSNDELQSKESFAIFSDAISGGNKGGKKNAKLEALKMAVVGDFFLTCEQAENLLDNFCDSQEAKIAAIGHFLPQMATANDACRLLAQNLGVDEILSLRLKLKNTFRAVTGNAGGHYYLDLSDPIDWHSGQKIAALNSLEKNKALVETPTRDTSQEGNFENFRNATYNGRPISLTSTWFISCPAAGRLHFDYVTTSRPVKGIKPMSSNTFRSLAATLFSGHNRKEVLKALNKLKSGKGTAADSKDMMGSQAQQDDDDDESSDEDSDAEEKRKLVRKSLLNRGGKTQLGKTLLQKLHIQRKRETLLEEKRKEQSFANASERDINEEVDRILWEQSTRAENKPTERVRRREGFTTMVNMDAVGRQRVMLTNINEHSVSSKSGKGSSHGLSIKRTEHAFISWMYYIDSTWEATKTAYVDYLIHYFRKAEHEITKDDPYGMMDPNFVSVLALKSNTFKDCRKQAMHKTLNKRLVSQQQQQYLQQVPLYQTLMGIRKTTASASPALPTSPVAASSLLGTLIPTAGTSMNAFPATVPLEKKIAILNQCMRYDKELLMLEVYLVFGLWFSCQQAVILMECFLEHGAPEEVAVKVFCLIFTRIIDIENIGLHMNSLSASIRYELSHRLGILNIWSALTPDCSVELDLASREGREAAKLMLRLAAVEPGEHIHEEEYHSSFLQPCKTGWHIPASWAENDNLKKAKGPPNFGVFRFSFSTDAERGVVPHWEARKEITIYRLLAGSRGVFVLALKSNKLNLPIESMRMDETGQSITARSSYSSELDQSSVVEGSKTEREEFLYEQEQDLENNNVENILLGGPMKQKYSIDTGVWVRAQGRL